MAIRLLPFENFMPDLNSLYPISYMVGNFLNWTMILGIFSQFSAGMCRKSQNSTSSQIFNPKFETSMGGFLFNYEFWRHLLQELCVF